MKRIALAVAVVVMAVGACKRAQNSNAAADSTRADSMGMADSMKMAPGDTTHMMDTTKAHPAPMRRP
jgi:nitrous oxide reductase accessory protein NosL